MAGDQTTAYRFKQFLLSLPGKRGLDVPEDIFDTIQPVAEGITQQLWGRPPTPHQLQHLHDIGAHTPQQIHEEFAKLPHPHSPGLSVGEYSAWKSAYGTYQMHGGG